MTSYLQKEKSNKKRTAQEREMEANTVGESHSVFTVLKLCCQTIQFNFKHDVNAFIQNDSFEKLSEPVAELVTVIGLDSLVFKEFIQTSVK